MLNTILRRPGRQSAEPDAASDSVASLKLPSSVHLTRHWQDSLDRFVERNTALPKSEAMEAAAVLLAARYPDHFLKTIEKAASVSSEFERLRTVAGRARAIEAQRRDSVATET